MIDPIWLKAVAKTLVLPPTGLLLLALAGLSMRRRFPRAGSFAAWTGVLVLLVLSIPTVAGLLVRSLDATAVFDPAQGSSAQAIVVLGGGTRRNAPEYGGDTLGELTLERLRYGTIVARVTGLPILLTGGAVYGGEPEAKLMQASLERDFGMHARWVEDRSRTTRENALRSAEILRANGIERVILVAHDFDMRRATAEFADAGIATIPAATGSTADAPATLLDFLPGIAGLRRSYYAIYEICANWVRWMAQAG
ncbi:MAG TPA: YdcF family protein [Casimicrobiaceae bacterium]